MYKRLKQICRKPAPYEFYTAETLWTDDHISKKMLEFHLNPDSEPASRNHDFIQNSINWIRDRFKVGPGLKIADFGCGPGLYANAFGEAGASVLGIDFSRRSISHARDQAVKKGLSTEFVQKNYLDFSSDERFDLITLIYCDLCALSPEQRRTLLRSFHGLLAEDGRLLLDVFSLKAFEGRREGSSIEHLLLEGFWSDEDYYGFLQTIKYDDIKVVLDRYAIIQESREWEIYNWLQYYPVEALAREFHESGFAVSEYYSDVSGAPFDRGSETIALVAKKR
ncbi:class I SAM-dependent methyltransferase [Desulfospira joergensenii]|uniref:class I SAM-dependent methyltransferase n=1 Tax=Desulfospira joergensenii TaxID=53329 RepID=UPI0003B522C4|nr:class I SAM-dependent methyltransferase [Desulfospira joergensenii]